MLRQANAEAPRVTRKRRLSHDVLDGLSGAPDGDASAIEQDFRYPREDKEMKRATGRTIAVLDRETAYGRAPVRPEAPAPSKSSETFRGRHEYRNTIGVPRVWPGDR